MSSKKLAKRVKEQLETTIELNNSEEVTENDIEERGRNCTGIRIMLTKSKPEPLQDHNYLDLGDGHCIICMKEKEKHEPKPTFTFEVTRRNCEKCDISLPKVLVAIAILPCGHVFCPDCWNEQQKKIDLDKCGEIKCLSPNCHRLISILKLINITNFCKQENFLIDVGDSDSKPCEFGLFKKQETILHFYEGSLDCFRCKDTHLSNENCIFHPMSSTIRKLLRKDLRACICCGQLTKYNCGQLTKYRRSKVQKNDVAPVILCNKCMSTWCWCCLEPMTYDIMKEVSNLKETYPCINLKREEMKSQIAIKNVLNLKWYQYFFEYYVGQVLCLTFLQGFIFTNNMKKKRYLFLAPFIIIGCFLIGCGVYLCSMFYWPLINRYCSFFEKRGCIESVSGTRKMIEKERFSRHKEKIEKKNVPVFELYTGMKNDSKYFFT